MGQVFALSEAFKAMPLDEIERLLESPIHEARAGAVKIMAKQATRQARDRRRVAGAVRALPAPHRSDRRLGPGGPRAPGMWSADTCWIVLVRSSTRWRAPRTSGSAGPRCSPRWRSFGVGSSTTPSRSRAILIDDPEDLVQKPVGACLREAGKQDRRTAARVPRPTRGDDAADGPAIRHRASRCRGHEPTTWDGEPPPRPVSRRRWVVRRRTFACASCPRSS